MSGPISTSPPRRTRRRNWGVALLAGLGAAVAVTLANAAPANAWGWENALRCYNYSSGDQCWINYYDTHSLAEADALTQYGRDQVCAKARDSITTGPVSPGSACASNTHVQVVYFTYPSVQKKGYVYWAGNGGAIYIDAHGRTN